MFSRNNIDIDIRRLKTRGARSFILKSHAWNFELDILEIEIEFTIEIEIEFIKNVLKKILIYGTIFKLKNMLQASSWIPSNNPKPPNSNYYCLQI